MELQTEAQPLCDKSFTVVSQHDLLFFFFFFFTRVDSCCRSRSQCSFPSLALSVQPDLGSKYTAWSSVSTLIQKNLLMKTHNPARYTASTHTCKQTHLIYHIIYIFCVLRWDESKSKLSSTLFHPCFKCKMLIKWCQSLPSSLKLLFFFTQVFSDRRRFGSGGATGLGRTRE